MNIFKQILLEFNKQNVKYCILRNYEFLLDTKKPLGSDLDITIAKQDIIKVKTILRKLQFVKAKQQFSLKHISYCKYITEIQKNIGFDIQIGGIYWNDMSYLVSYQIIPRRIKKSFFYTLSDEDAFIMYVSLYFRFRFWINYFYGLFF